MGSGTCGQGALFKFSVATKWKTVVKKVDLSKDHLTGIEIMRWVSSFHSFESLKGWEWDGLNFTCVLMVASERI
jgi:hypothetical protein